MTISDSLIELRILLMTMCDGYSTQLSNKSTPLTTRIKVLYLLQSNDASPSELVEKLCIAKGNLANLLKEMINDGVVISYRNDQNSKNINYRATQKGITELNEFKRTMLEGFSEKFDGDDNKLSKLLNEVIQLIKGENYGKDI
jgi:DNA-binding MarR family transcriptional regulator